MLRKIIFVYGLNNYLLGALAYFVGFGGFLANMLGIYSIDTGRQAPIAQALLINISLIVMFGLPHSLMARKRFKKWLVEIIPPAAERSTYMLQAGLLGLLLIWQWRAIPVVLWQIQNTLLATFIWGIYWIGWGIAFLATLSINHFELTGLQQVFANLHKRSPKPIAFKTPWLYRIVRHPMQFGVLIAFWIVPIMTVGRLVFALGMTSYILIGLYFEERDLVNAYGRSYLTYQQEVPKIIPLPRKREPEQAHPSSLSDRKQDDLWFWQILDLWVRQGK